MQNDDLEKLLNDLDNDLSNKNEQSNLSVISKQESSQGAISSWIEFFETHRKIILGVAVGLVVLFGVYQFGVNNAQVGANKETNTRAVTEVTSKQATRSTQSDSANGVEEKLPEIDKRISITEKITVNRGLVNGNDVFVRSQPSTDSKPITMVNKGEEVEVLTSRAHNDGDERFYVMKVNGYKALDIDTRQEIILNSGLALKYLGRGNNSDQAVCMIKTGDRDRRVWLRYGFGNGPSCVVEKMSNNEWYNVRLGNGQVGWIYSKFVTLR